MSLVKRCLINNLMVRNFVSHLGDPRFKQRPKYQNDDDDDDDDDDDNNNNNNSESKSKSEIMAAQDQALQTKYYPTKILNTETDSKCRLCQQFDETIDHIISACPILAKEQYTNDMIVCPTTLQHMQGNRGTTGQKTLVRTCTKISRNK